MVKRALTGVNHGSHHIPNWAPPGRDCGAEIDGGETMTSALGDSHSVGGGGLSVVKPVAGNPASLTATLSVAAGGSGSGTDHDTVPLPTTWR